MERLQKVISNSGYTSRRKAEDLIINKKVLVNGEVANLGDKVKENDIITIDGVELIKNDNNVKVYYLLNKPRGIISTSHDEKGRKTVIDLIETDKRIFPVGRLDYDTTGAIILTNDGDLTNLLLHPKGEIDKVYLAKVKGIIKGIDIHKLETGVIIDNKKTSPAKAKLKSYNKKNNTSMVLLTIHEGSNHQVKKMFASIGFEVLKLTRIKFAFLDIKNLKSGEYRPLTVKEVKKLYSIGKK